MKVIVIDRSFAITRREKLSNGYLKVPGVVARAGNVQAYLAKELELTDRKPDEIVYVYRPPEEVFSADSLKSYADADVTNDHPNDLVNSKSFKTVSVGHASSDGRATDDDCVEVDLIIKDEEAIKSIEAGKIELSAGYLAEYVSQPGETQDGQKYEFIQKDIRINHIALVDKARAGKQARLYDSKTTPEEKIIMKGHVTLDSSTVVEVEDASTAKLIQNTIDSLRKQSEDSQVKVREVQKVADEEQAKREKAEEDLEEEKKKSSDAALNNRVKEVMSVRQSASKMIKDFKCESLDTLEIKRQALGHVRPKVDWKDKSEAYVLAAWDAEEEKTDEEKEKEKSKQSTDGIGADFQELDSRYVTDSGAMVGDTAYESFLKGEDTNGGSK